MNPLQGDHGFQFFSLQQIDAQVGFDLAISVFLTQYSAIVNLKFYDSFTVMPYLNRLSLKVNYRPHSKVFFLKKNVFHTTRNHTSDRSTLVWKPGVDVTRSLKQEYQWSHKGTYVLQNFNKKKRKKKKKNDANKECQSLL